MTYDGKIRLPTSILAGRLASLIHARGCPVFTYFPSLCWLLPTYPSRLSCMMPRYAASAPRLSPPLALRPSLSPPI